MKLTIVCVLFFFVADAASQDRPELPSDSTSSDSFIVATVRVEGNDHTREFVILREMTLKPGAVATAALLNYDRDRIYSLGLFNRVSVSPIPLNDREAELVVVVEERWFLYPYPIFGIKDRDWDKLYYGLGLIHMNFRGRNEKLFGSFALGYDPWVSLAYRNPFVNSKGTIFLETRAVASTVRNRSLLAILPKQENFDERHIALSLTVGRRSGIYHTTWLQLGFESVKVSEYFPFRTNSADGSDSYPVLSAGYSYDSRDVTEYPSAGGSTKVSVAKHGLPSAELDFSRYSMEGSKFIPGPFSTVVALRTYGNVTAGGRIPSYARVFIGYGERIRGHFDEVMEGEHSVGSTAEIHFPILAPRFVVADFVPKEFGVWRFGIVGAAFADAGSVWFRGEPFAMNRVVAGYGVGIHFLLPYSIVLRAEHAWNESGVGEFILDAGTLF